MSQENSNKLSLVGRHAEIMKAVYDRINNKQKKPLHPGQVEFAKAYFTKGLRVMMSQWGRNGGKSECALYIATVAALLTDNFIVMIICPELKQGKKIYWQSSRLQNYPPPQYIAETSKTEASITFTNGSVITIEGCENYQALRGVKPNLVIYDEFQDHSKEFHLEVMAPNLLGKDASLVVFGTPPKKRSAYYVEFREELLKQIKDGDGTRGYFEYPTSVNPTIDKIELQKIRKTLLESSNDPIWYREYEGKMMFGGEDVVFPKWEPNRHCRSHQVVMSYLEQDKKKLKWFTICDPGTSTCFAVLFVCYNPFTQQLFFLDEIYEKDRARTDSRQIWARIRKKEEELYPNGEWKRYYDEAAAWFYNEIASMHRGMRLSLSPSKKQRSNEETDISRIKMCMAQPGAMTVSDRCYWLRWEIESYITIIDKNGDAAYVDSNNHLLDCTKYLMQVSNWSLMEKAEEVKMNQAGIARVESIPVAEWADNAIENSLWGDDGVSDYFN